ncbi:hypothetical protein ACFOZ0_11505 [Streptomyces yaanensis]|uniref:Uncharacterized protein n=1 Tax=Streptomyces yaanensis TaxID=1142239 RepID=A0ABV7SAE5_9ACTN|nr:hypothetical protein [Streptomyces sp. CGMCC 4.7035]WNB96954.1 hypothetical protein Q2K21_02085 [Streptomyces sp. CGMCC 4.7035]
MGSLRNPVGPLPSSIYWRRRAVLLSVLALLALLVAWVVTSGGGGGKNSAGGSDAKHPTSSITPGPSGTGPAISQHPGGRDESTGGDGSGSPGAGDSGGADSGSGGPDDGAGGSDGSGSSGGQLPAGSGSSLPNCTSNAVELTLKSAHNAYAPGDTPTFDLIAKNSSGTDCKVDLGPKNAVLTITQSGSDDDIWSSADCPSGSGSVLFRVPANNQVAYTVKWDRKSSAPDCATPAAGSASAGTYLVEVKASGFPKVQTSFVLSKD